MKPQRSATIGAICVEYAQELAKAGGGLLIAGICGWGMIEAGLNTIGAAQATGSAFAHDPLIQNNFVPGGIAAAVTAFWALGTAAAAAMTLGGAFIFADKVTEAMWNVPRDVAGKRRVRPVLRIRRAP